MIRKIFTIAMLSLLCLGVGLSPADAATDPDVTLEPEHILMGAGYNGQNIAIAGRIPSDAAAFIRITGKPEHTRLKQKGRAMGVLWMNLGSVEISKAPDVFLLFLPEGADASGRQEPAWRKLGIGLEGLRQQVDIVAQDENKDALFDEFVKLKEKSGLYGIVDNAVHYGPPEGATKSFNAILSLPSALPQGIYQIEVLSLKNGAVETAAKVKIDAREVGLPSWLRASDNYAQE